MGTSGAWRAGKNSRVEVANQRVAMASYSVTDRAGDIDTSNIESEGFEEGITGLFGADWDVGGKWDAGLNPFEDPPGLYPRDDGTELSIYTNVADAKFYNFPFYRCIQATLRMTASQGVDIEARGKNQGAFTRPSGSV